MLKQALTKSWHSLEEDPEQAPCLQRRGFLKLAAVSVGGLMASPALANLSTRRERSLSLHCTKTGESVRTVYWTPGEGYLDESIARISWALRDHRNDQVKNFDPKLLDQMHALQLKLGYTKPFHVISGYRSPQTNAMLRRRSRGVAKNSFHMYGKAADIRMPGRSISDLHRAALSLNAGGVGYYPRSNFIHIDTGPPRSWG